MNIELLYNALAKIISMRENVEIKYTIKRKDEKNGIYVCQRER